MSNEEKFDSKNVIPAKAGIHGTSSAGNPEHWAPAFAGATDFKECEPDDPIEMVGMEIPGQSEEALRDMMLCFAEEFVREGWGEDKLMAMFKNPFYAGPHLAWKQKGDAFIKSVIREAMNMWRCPSA